MEHGQVFLHGQPGGSSIHQLAGFTEVSGPSPHLRVASLSGPLLHPDSLCCLPSRDEECTGRLSVSVEGVQWSASLIQVQLLVSDWDRLEMDLFMSLMYVKLSTFLTRNLWMDTGDSDIFTVN